MPWIRGSVGAVATQAETNPLLGNAILNSLERGVSAEDALNNAIARDSGREQRQCHVVDNRGNCASWNGSKIVSYSGSICKDGVSVAGNMLSNDGVLQSMLDSYFENSHLPLAHRVLCALRAAESAGGDKRGPGQSAAIYITKNPPYPIVNLRVDHNTTGTLFEDLEILVLESDKEYVRGFYDNCPATFGAIRGLSPRNEVKDIFESDEVRCLSEDLALALRAAAYHGFAEGIDNHMSVAIPNTKYFLLNPRGLLWSEVQGRDIVMVDENGVLLQGKHPVNTHY